MKLLRMILCLIGFHAWEYKGTLGKGNGQVNRYTCTRCGREKEVFYQLGA